MPSFERPGVTLHYEEHGTGFPVLLLAPGGMNSTIAAWGNAPWDPVTHLAQRYRVIAMDQRNAGSSVAEVHGSDGWDTYTADQLALLDHLGVDECAVLGMCIGGAFIANLLVTATRPGRGRAAAHRPRRQPAPVRGEVRRVARRDRGRPPRGPRRRLGRVPHEHVGRRRDAVLRPRRGARPHRDAVAGADGDRRLPPGARVAPSRRARAGRGAGRAVEGRAARRRRPRRRRPVPRGPPGLIPPRRAAPAAGTMAPCRAGTTWCGSGPGCRRSRSRPGTGRRR
ncbi:alpha/beta fold hydrolase [Pseudonocardia sp. SID8383]|nr:alpha/beta fold hydrolase [Pseudonocardia sp. SID8383]